jgi:ParB family chromosome partitioning protein
MAKQFGLGKGLGALLPEPEPVPLTLGEAGPGESGEPAADGAPAGEAAAPSRVERGGVLRVAIGRISSNPEQPRKSFSEESIAELADSIRRHGVIQPIIVEDEGEGRYMIVAGERRWRAAEKAGLREMPVIVRSFSHEKRLEIALIENVQREDLNPVEEAEAYRGIMELTGCTQEEVADKVGKSRPAVANALRLLKLGGAALDALRDARISAGHARALLSVQDPTDREILLARLLAEELSVRQAEAAAQDLVRNKQGMARVIVPKAEPVERQRDPELLAVEQRLIGAFGTKVSIKGDGKKGVVHIEYYSLEDLERILEVAAGGGA